MKLKKIKMFQKKRYIKTKEITKGKKKKKKKKIKMFQKKR
jgi:hypothetical protein